MIKENQLKDTVLDDSAEIYQPREDKTEKQKLSEMSFKEKVTYFNNYYRFKTLVLLGTVIFIIYIAHSIFSPRPETVFFAAVVNNAINSDIAITLQDDFGTKLNINSDLQNINIDTSFQLQNESGIISDYTMANEQKLSTYMFAGDIDVIIAPESYFANYAKNGFLSKLSDQLPTDMFRNFANSFYYSTSEDSTALGAYGMYLDNKTILYDNNGDVVDTPILGILVNSAHKDNAVEFIRYLYQLDK